MSAAVARVGLPPGFRRGFGFGVWRGCGSGSGHGFGPGSPSDLFLDKVADQAAGLDCFGAGCVLSRHGLQILWRFWWRLVV